MAVPDTATPHRASPIWGPFLLGLGLGGFFDGIVLHQVLQWHHMVSSWARPDTLQNLEFNTLWDGLFHVLTYGFTVLGLLLLWRDLNSNSQSRRINLLAGGLLLGFGTFNLVEGMLNHQLLSLHHVNETVPRDQWIYWDMAFMVWGATMVIAGLLMLRRSAGRSPAERSGEPID